MNRRIFISFLCIALLISCIPVSVNAEKIIYYQVQIDAGDGAKTEKAIIENDEIYIAATSFSKYTRFEFNSDSQTFLVKGQEADKAFKKIIVNAETKKAAVGNKIIELRNSFIVDGEVYLPFCQMLPILNANIFKVDSGVIYIVNNKVSMAEILYDFNIDDYRFDLSEEFFGNYRAATNYIGWSYVLDTVVNFRFDRLDIVFESGNCEDYQNILCGYLKDDELFYEAMSEKNTAGELLQSITGLVGVTEPLNDVYEWFEKVAKLEISEGDKDFLEFDDLEMFIKNNYHLSEAFNDELKMMVRSLYEDLVPDNVWKDVLPGGLSIADILSGIDYLYTLLNHVEDHRNMLDVVYGISSETSEYISGTSSSFTSPDSEHLAAKQVYELYSGDIIPSYTEKVTKEIFQRMLEDHTIFNAAGVYKLTAGLAGSILELYMAGDSGDRALLPLHTNVMNSAMRKASAPTLDTEKSTNEYRLSLLLMLLSSKSCYEIMAETASDKGQDVGYYHGQIEKIEKMIKGLYLVAENVAFDTYENYKTFAEQNRNEIKNSDIFGKYDISDILSEWYFNEYDRAGVDLAILADVTRDSLPELIIVVCNKEAMSIEGKVYTVDYSGDVKLIESIMGSEIHAGGFFGWYLKKVENGYNLIQETFGMWQGYGEVDVTEYYLDKDGNREVLCCASVSSESDNRVTTEEWKYYIQEGRAIMNNVSVLYKSSTNIGGLLVPLEEYLILEQVCLELDNNIKEGPITEIVIEWDGKYPGSDELINIDFDVRGTLNDGSNIVSDGSGQFLNSDGELIGGYNKEITKKKGILSIYLYVDGNFEFEAFDGNYSPVDPLSISAISDANAIAYVKVLGQEPVAFRSQNSLYRSHTGYWFWGICGVHNGNITEYDTAWIDINSQTTGISQTQSVEERVSEIRKLYYMIQNNLSEYKIEDGGSDITRYLDEDGKIRKIIALETSYSDLNIASDYTAEYFYDNDAVIFLFLHNQSEEHRIYLAKNDYRRCIRYIDQAGIVYDYPEGIDVNELPSIGQYCGLAMQELHWAGDISQGGQLDLNLLQTFPFEESISDACKWLENNGYTYEYNKGNSSVEAQIANGWELVACDQVYGIEGVFLALYSMRNSQNIFETCKTNLENIYGAPCYDGADDPYPSFWCGNIEIVLSDDIAIYFNPR